MNDSSNRQKTHLSTHQILLWLSLCLLALYTVPRILYVTRGISLWIFDGTARDINNLLHFFGVLCLLLGGGIRLIQRHRPFRVLITLVLILLILGALFLQGFYMLFSTAGVQHTALASPDGIHRLVIREHALLFDTNILVYEEIAPGILKELGYVSAGDAQMPVATGQCEFLWSEDGVTVAAPCINSEGRQRFFAYAD